MNNDKDQSGFEDAPCEHICGHPSHNPPTHLVIPQGKIYNHVCPGCGVTMRITNPKQFLF